MKADQKRSTAAEDGAAYWFARTRSDIGRGERLEFERWISSAENAAAYSECEAFWDFAGTVAGDSAISAMRKDALALGPERRRPWIVQWSAAAAALLVMLTAAVFLVARPAGESNRAEQFAERVSPDARLFRTEVGQRSTITLEDGSTVELNADSLLRVEFTGERRQLALLHGQALFEVARDSERPFVVRAGDQLITAVGTLFDVRLRSGEMRVTLIEGKISVGRRAGDGGGTPETTRLLTAGQQLVAVDGQLSELRPANTEQAVGWMSGRILFTDEPLGDVVEEINLYSHRKIRLSEPQLRDLRVSGVFRVGAADRFANALELTFPIAAEREQDGDIVLSSR